MAQKNRCEGLKGKDLHICRRNHQRIDELAKNVKQSWHNMLDDTYMHAFDEIPDSFKEDNYLLSKAIITVWCRKEPYAPLEYTGHKQAVKRLGYFI